MSWTSLCEFEELTEGRGKYAEVEGFQLAVFLNGGKISILDNTCPHANGSLSDGFIEDNCAICPLHYWAFHLESGELKDSSGPCVKTYPSRLLDHAGKKLVQAELPIF